MKKTTLILSLILPALALAESNTTREVAVDWNNVKGDLDRAPLYCVGSGHAALALRSNYAKQLATVHEECGFEYIRFHGIFHDAMGVVLEDRYNNDEMCFNFQYVDEVYDMVLKTGMKPYVELSFMPEMLSSGDKTVFWWKANVTTPKDYSLWGKLVNEFTAHLVDRYGIDEVRTWYFEVWNECDHSSFFSGKKEDYFKLYQTSVEAVKKVDDQLRTGGPATSGGHWNKAFLTFCKENKLPLDFFTTHTYAVHGFLDEFGTKQLKMARHPRVVVSSVEANRKRLDEAGYPEVPLHYTEWGASYSSRDPIHDSYVQAPFLLEKLKRVEGLQEAMSYWTFSDIFEEAAPPFAPFHGGFGLQNLQGIRKPSFFSYKFFNEMEPKELGNSDASSWASRSDRDLTILLWELNLPEQSKDQPNQTFYNSDLKPAAGTPVTVNATNLPAGPYKMELFRVGYRSNDALTTYIDMGSPRPLSRAQLATLQLASDGSPEIAKTIMIANDGTFEVPEIEMRANDIIFIKLQRLD